MNSPNKNRQKLNILLVVSLSIAWLAAGFRLPAEVELQTKGLPIAEMGAAVPWPWLYFTSLAPWTYRLLGIFMSCLLLAKEAFGLSKRSRMIINVFALALLASFLLLGWAAIYFVTLKSRMV